MILQELLPLYDDPKGILQINDEKLYPICKANILSFLSTDSDFTRKLNECKVEAIGFYDNEFCIRLAISVSNLGVDIPYEWQVRGGNI